MGSLNIGASLGTVADGSLNDRAARIFEYLVKVQQLRTRVVRSVDAYRAVMWLGKLPTSHALRFGVETDEPGVWLAIDRVERIAPPVPPDIVRPWLTERSLRESSQTLPTLSRRAARAVQVVTPEGDHETQTEELLLEDHPEVESALREWAPEWQAWAADDRPRAAVGEAYHDLYEIYQDAKALAETYEVVVGFGCLMSRSGGQDVTRHLITVPATIELDLDSGRLTVLPSPDGRAPVLEEDMLTPADTASDEVRQAIRASLNSLDDPWAPEPDGIAAVLRTWVNGAGPDAAFNPGMQPSFEATRTDSQPTVRFAPALILRERTKRSLVAACEQIIAQLRAGADVPSGVRQFAEITDGRVSEAEDGLWNTAYADTEVYFPKLANDEQRQIRQRLADHQTVVVQGPPGTGKTHTIANLISDLLAHGQRVLVTSTTTRALTVLKEQLPDEIRDLCVSVTDDAGKGQADLERSVSTILTEADRANPKASGREESRLRGQLDDARAREHEALTELRSIRERETYVYGRDIGDYSGTLQQIAQRLAEEQDALGWFDKDPDETLSLTVADVATYLQLLRRATPELRALSGRVPDLSEIVQPADFQHLAERRAELTVRAQELADARRTDEFAALMRCDPAQRDQIRFGVTDLTRRRQDLGRRPEPWIADAVRDVTGGRERSWRQRSEATAAGIGGAQSWLQAVGGSLVTGIERLELADAVGQVTMLEEHLANGGKIKGLLGRSKVAKTAALFLESVRVNGRTIEGLEQLQPARGRVMAELELSRLEDLWGYSHTPFGPQEQRLAVLTDENIVLEQVLTYADVVSALDQRLRSVAAMPAIDLREGNGLIRLQKALEAVDLQSLHDDVQARTERTKESLADLGAAVGAVPAVSQAAGALGHWDTAEYRAAFHAFETAHAANTVLDQLDRARNRVAQAAPVLAVRIEETASDPIWDERLPKLIEAWAWSVWDKRLRDKNDPEAEQRWRDRLDVATDDVQVALKRLATNRGWVYALQRMTSRESTHLKMYSQAVRKIGKATGKYANRYREDARKHLQECQSAVPAWIMPMHRVFDTVPVDRPNIFDVVIVDEASQSGPEGLLLSWLAPRMVVVGDDKQVSPSNVGLDLEAVFTLLDSYLGPLEHRSLYGPRSSFFDQAVGMSGSRIMLREHFRCMPEIIGFSNDLCYRGELVPLRQYGAERLPPLRTTYINGAVVSGSRDYVNEREADEIVSQIEKCCADPAYDGKTMGVITLLGHSQDRLIIQRLVDVLGVRVVEERRLRAGNAEAFQGDERDVIFMSMVSSLQSTTGPVRIGTLSKESDQQRLNVAASRARDQVWLFHSVQPGDLSGKDLRQRYLQYLLKPPVEQDALDIGEVMPDRRHSAFDSLFEQRVFIALRERGFRVRPQVKVGGYRIDLVVEGGTKRLAVECDGDAFHDTETADSDAARQRDLERVGWTFWRVRGSTFFRDPEQALEPLWQLLEALDIQPLVYDPAAETDSVSEVAALAVPLDLDLDSPRSDAPTAAVPVTSASAASVVEEPVMPGEQRFRNGKMLLSATARDRVRQEAEAVRQWLADPPSVHAVDSRSHAVELARQEQHREELEDRLDYLGWVLAQSVVEQLNQGSRWVTPGCIIGLRYRGESDIERLIVSALRHGAWIPVGATPLSPMTELSKALEHAQLGDSIRYDTASGTQEADIVEVID
ncbi:AAA domain-containing protein [Kribbella sp. NPDC050241]|uniref:AAA domain-containing protein n=1 Tax=Kribbella sp. NPDC050241 TaxID=3364115 RepID=UPI0037A2618A